MYTKMKRGTKVKALLVVLLNSFPTKFRSELDAAVQEVHLVHHAGNESRSR